MVRFIDTLSMIFKDLAQLMSNKLIQPIFEVEERDNYAMELLKEVGPNLVNQLIDWPPTFNNFWNARIEFYLSIFYLFIINH